jgi:hypothetical protein
MAVLDDVKRLAAEDFVFLSHSAVFRSPGGDAVAPAARFWYRGRLRQAGDGSWVFQPVTDTDGFFGIALGVVDGSWTSQESPGVGILINIIHQVLITTPAMLIGAAGAQPVTFFENISIGQNPGANFQS